MRIALTGTPGTGKSTVAPQVADKLGYELIDLNEFIHENDISDDYDEERESAAVDTDELNEAISDVLPEDCIVDGHLAHFVMDLDLAIVLRTEPDELKDRLSQRLNEENWDEHKVNENVEAERLDAILQEAVNQHPEVTYEVDTSSQDPEKVVEEIVYLVKNPDARDMFQPGETEWDLNEPL